MKRKLVFTLTVAWMFAVLAMPADILGQDAPGMPQPQGYPTHYKVIDTGTFGGPNGHLIIGQHILNNRGMFVGFADTLDPDPYAPDDECWDGDCLIAHAYRWSDGKLTDIGVLGGGPNSETTWLSENGLVAGDSQNGLLDPLVGFWQVHGVFWRDNEALDVGTLDGGYNSLARAVNNRGEVVGLSTTLVPDANAMIMSFGLPYAFQTKAYRWRDGLIQDLGTLGGPDAMALEVNENGQVIGNSYVNSDPSAVCGNPGFGYEALNTGAFLWQNGKMINLGSLGGTCTNAIDLNNRGQVVGFSYLAGDQESHPFLWEAGRFIDLGTTGGHQALANHVNELGDVVGWQTAVGHEEYFHAALWSHGQIIDLGYLSEFGPNQCGIPLAINSRKQVVGLAALNCAFYDDSQIRAFLWEPGSSMRDLNTMISPSLGLQLTNATINESGEIAAFAFFPDGTYRPVLLIPCVENDSENCQDSITASGLRAMRPTSPILTKSSSGRVLSNSIPMNLRARLPRKSQP